MQTSPEFQQQVTTTLAQPTQPPSRGSRVMPISLYDYPATYPIKGNEDSGIYLVPGGKYYDRTQPEVCFATPADAESARSSASKRWKDRHEDDPNDTVVTRQSSGGGG